MPPPAPLQSQASLRGQEEVRGGLCNSITGHLERGTTTSTYFMLGPYMLLVHVSVDVWTGVRYLHRDSYI